MYDGGMSGKNIIAIASKASGVGKTWFASNLAQSFSLYRERVLFFDADVGGANIGAQLGADFTNNFKEIVEGKTTLNQIVKRFDKAKFDIISCKKDGNRLASAPVGRLQVIGEDLSVLSSYYDRVIVDLSDDNGKCLSVFSNLADDVVVVCTEDPASITEAYGFVKNVIIKYGEKPIGIVVNQAESLSEGKRAYEILAKGCLDFMGTAPSLLGVVRRDARVRDAIRNQTLMVNRYPTSEALFDVMEIAKKMLTKDF